MSRHRVSPTLWHRRNRRVYLFGRMHFFRINYDALIPKWWTNDGRNEDYYGN